MANPEHVEIVKAGADAINDWRKKYPDEQLDLDSAALSKVQLRSADLRGAFLGNANLIEADLRDASMEGARLLYSNVNLASLGGANLSDANLGGASFINANLEGANLCGANLTFTNLTGVRALGANFERARFMETILAAVDLSGAISLERIEHGGPSILDERTLRMSWPLPDAFLRSVGLSDQYIEYLPSLMGEAIQFYSCFISYSSKDDEFARRLHADLQAKGVRCWFAKEDLRIGDKFRPRIDEAIRLHDKLLLILSEDAVNSTWVEDEVESALEKERMAKQGGEERTVLFPIRLDSAVMETDAAWAANIRRTRHIGDFSAWKDHDAYQKSFERLLRDLKSGAKEGGNGES